MWVVAHFNYYNNKYKNNSSYSTKGVVLMSYGTIANSKSYNTRTTANGYYGSIVNTTTCPAIASALSTVLGSYLLSFGARVSSMVDDNIASMAGSGKMGATNDNTWIETQCIIPSEIQVYGARVYSSSHYDVGEANCKLALFNFILHTGWSRGDMLLRDIASTGKISAAGYFGYAVSVNADDSCNLRPLIYIG